jgi:hypothetical protein
MPGRLYSTVISLLALNRMDDGTVTFAVEFGDLNDAQWVVLDGHPLATAAPVQLIDHPGVWVAVFSGSSVSTIDEMYDELRGWALSEALPIRGMVGH